MDSSLSEYFAERDIEPPEIVDLRDREAPEPMCEILLACAGMVPGALYLAHLPHVPNPLFPHLESRHMKWRVFEQDDGSAMVLIWKGQ